MPTTQVTFEVRTALGALIEAVDVRSRADAIADGQERRGIPGAVVVRVTKLISEEVVYEPGKVAA